MHRWHSGLSPKKRHEGSAGETQTPCPVRSRAGRASSAAAPRLIEVMGQERQLIEPPHETCHDPLFLGENYFDNIMPINSNVSKTPTGRA